jgi:glycerol-3-phosphate O-acyltransferase
MNWLLGLDRLFLATLTRLLSLWVRPRALPIDTAEQLRGRGRPLLYVLEHAALTDLLALVLVCRSLGLPSPVRRFSIGQVRERRSSVALERRQGWLRSRRDRRLPDRLLRIVTATLEAQGDHVDLIPVSVYWGRAPGKETGRLRLLFGEGWTIAGPFRRFLSTLVNGRQTLVRFGEPIAPALLMVEGDAARVARRAVRQMRLEFRNARVAVLGPDLAIRRSIVAAVLARRAVRAAIALETRDSKKSRREALLVARRYALEIAADYSPRAIALMWNPFTWLWNRLYDGVEVIHGERLELAAGGAQLVYVPSHRSHMDYLLLAYVIHGRGFAVPHTAAGINLNLPLIGRILRKCGAFYLRRSFKGHPLYPVVFMSYLGVMMRRGHPIEYFIEGGRSRTGRLLKPKTGMLSMTARSFLQDPSRPVVFVPVYFGYEKLVEAETYVGELSGAPKEKETVLGLLGAISILRRKYGRVFVSFGEPLDLATHLDSIAPEWRTATGEGKPAWLNEAVDQLAENIQRRVNAAVAISPVALVSMVLLSTPRQAMVEADLIRQLDLCRDLACRLPYAPDASCTPMDGAAMLAHARELGMLETASHGLGDVVRFVAEAAVTSAYYRNSILHAYALPSLIACAFLNNSVVRTQDVQRLAWRIYPYVAQELFLRWSEEELPAAVDAILEAFADLHLLERETDGSGWRRPLTGTREAVQLSMLAHTTLEVVERYYLSIALLLQSGSGEITQDALERRCHLMASRMALLYELRSPEFFDRGMFRQFLELLRRRGVLGTDEAGRLTYEADLLAVASDARLVLSEQIRHSVLQVTHG